MAGWMRKNSPAHLVGRAGGTFFLNLSVTGWDGRGRPPLHKRSGYHLLLVLIGRDEGFGYERFVTGWSGVLRAAWFEGSHGSGVEGGGHLEEQAGEWFGHSHLNEEAAHLLVGHLNVFEVGLADGLADNGGNFGVGEIALSLQFTGLLAADGGVQEGIGGCETDVASGDHAQFEIGAKGSGGGAHHSDRSHLGKSIFHEVSGAQVQHIRGGDLVEVLFKMMKTNYGPGAAGFVGADAAERDHIL